jgi:UDP-N-acetylmuramoylalanine-D-glutamate ligase
MRFHHAESRVKITGTGERGIVIANYVAHNGLYMILVDEIYRLEDEDDDGIREVLPEELDDW